MMIHKIKTTALAVAILFAAADALLAQSYALSPGDSIVATAQFDDLTVYNILQNNISSDSLFMSWEKVSADVPAAWEALLCDNNNCYPDLKENGVMHPVIPGEYAFLSVHITPHINAGTAIIRYVVWETNNPSSRDTLTWMISAGLTGIENQATVPASLIVTENQLLIRNSIAKEIRIVNMQGQIFLDRKLESSNTAIDVSEFPIGIYLVELKGANVHEVQNVFLK